MGTYLGLASDKELTWQRKQLDKATNKDYRSFCTCRGNIWQLGAWHKIGCCIRHMHYRHTHTHHNWPCCHCLVWDTDGSKINEETGAGVYGLGARKKLGLALANIPQCSRRLWHMPSRHAQVDNLDRGYRNRNIPVPSDSQAAIKALTISTMNWSRNSNSPL
jgi:hypothetical protein